ncbi:MAG: hypothetical protein V7K54_28665 [Nostoc sp.]
MVGTHCIFVQPLLMGSIHLENTIHQIKDATFHGEVKNIRTHRQSDSTGLIAGHGEIFRGISLVIMLRVALKIMVGTHYIFAEPLLIGSIHQGNTIHQVKPATFLGVDENTNTRGISRFYLQTKLVVGNFW